MPFLRRLFAALFLCLASVSVAHATVGTTASSTVALGNGATVSFNYNFNMVNAAYAVVTITQISNNQQTVLTPTQYTITGVGNSSGGTVIYPLVGSPLATGFSITIARVVPLLQTTSLCNQGPTLCAVEKALDYLTFIAQQLQAEINTLSSGGGGGGGNIVGPISSTIGDVATWANTTGTLLADGGTLGPLATLKLGGALYSTGGFLNGSLNTACSLTAASTTNLGACTSNVVSVTGSTAITSFGASASAANPIYLVTLAGAPLLTFNASSLILPGGGNIQGATGDSFTAQFLGGANWQVISYTRANGQPIIGSSSGVQQAAISGFLPSSIAGTNSTASMTISPGQASDYNDAVSISNSSIGAWNISNGDAINGLQGAGNLMGSYTYDMYECSGTVGVGSYLVKASSYPLAAASCPSGYNTYNRRIFSINTLASGAPISGTAVALGGGTRRFIYSNPVADLSAAPVSGTAALSALTVPTGFKVGWFGRIAAGNTEEAIAVSSPDEPAIVPPGTIAAWTTNPSVDLPPTPSLPATAVSVVNAYRTTNTSGQLRFIAASGTGGPTVYAFTIGYDDFMQDVGLPGIGGSGGGNALTINGASVPTIANAVVGDVLALTSTSGTGTLSYSSPTGVSSLTAGTGISISSSTGGISIANTGVLSLTAGTGISISATTGAITVATTTAGGPIYSCGTVGGTANTLTATCAGFTLAAGNGIIFAPISANTGAASFNPNGLGATQLRVIVGGVASVLSANQLLTGFDYTAIYDGSNFYIAAPSLGAFFYGTETGGTANAKTITAPGYNASVGGTLGTFVFTVNDGTTNTGSVSLTVNGASFTLEKNTTGGLANLTGGELVAAQTYIVAGFGSAVLVNPTYSPRAPQTITFSTGISSSVNSGCQGLSPVVQASTLDKILATALPFVCSGNPVLELDDFGAGPTCGSPTAMGAVTLTAASLPISQSSAFSSSAIAAGDILGWRFTGGTCTNYGITGSAAIHTN